MPFPKVPCPKCRAADIGNILMAAIVGPSGEAYCSNCGLKIVTKCEKCGAGLTVREHYCSSCGTENPIFVENK